MLCLNYRSCSVSSLHTHHISWDNDCLVIDMSKQKGDQAGERITPKHVYANPHEPALCPVLALALHIFGTGFLTSANSTMVFEGTPYEVFTKWLKTTLGKVNNLVYHLFTGAQGELGSSIVDYGTHSFRKGVLTTIGGVMEGPNITSICLRAGWSLGKVPDTYITFSNPGDQLCGRLAAGLRYDNGEEFSVLPAHFESNDSIKEYQWAWIIPGYENYPQQFQMVLPYLVAAIVQHYDWITAVNEQGVYVNVDRTHPIHTSRIMTSGIIHDLKSIVITGKTGYYKPSGMFASGVPCNVIIKKAIQDALKATEALAVQVEEVYERLTKSLPELLLNKIRDELKVTGLKEMTVTELRRILDQYFEERERNAVASNSQVADQNSNGNGEFATTVDGYPVYHWGGKLNRPVDKDFRMPIGTSKSIGYLFLKGIKNSNGVLTIRPLRKILPRDLDRKDQQYFVKASFVYCHIMNIAHQIFEENQITLDDMTLALYDELWDAAFAQLVTRVEVHRGKPLIRPETLRYTTVYDMIKELE